MAWYISFGQAAGFASNYDESIQTRELQAFNAKFEQYNVPESSNNKLSIGDVATAAALARELNKKQGLNIGILLTNEGAGTAINLTYDANYKEIAKLVEKYSTQKYYCYNLTYRR